MNAALLSLLGLAVGATSLVISLFLLFKIKEMEKKIYVYPYHAKGEPSKIIGVRKPKKRYIITKTISREAISKEKINYHIRKAIAALYGEPFLMLSHASLIFYDEESGIGIIRTNREGIEQVIASLHIAGKEGSEKKFILAPLKTAGTLKKAREIARKLGANI